MAKTLKQLIQERENEIQALDTRLRDQEQTEKMERAKVTLEKLSACGIEGELVGNEVYWESYRIEYAPREGEHSWNPGWYVEEGNISARTEYYSGDGLTALVDAIRAVNNKIARPPAAGPMPKYDVRVRPFSNSTEDQELLAMFLTDGFKITQASAVVVKGEYVDFPVMMTILVKQL